MQEEEKNKFKNRPYIIDPKHSQDFEQLLKEISNDPEKIAYLEKCKTIYNKLSKNSPKKRWELKSHRFFFVIYTML